MHIVNSYANDIQRTGNNKQRQNANYHLNRFMSASVWSSLCYLISAESLPAYFTFNVSYSSHLHGKQFPSIQKKTTSTCKFTFQNLSSEYVVSIRLFYLVPVRNTEDVQFLLLPPFTIQPLSISKEHLIFDSITFHNHKEDIYNQVHDGTNYFQFC